MTVVIMTLDVGRRIEAMTICEVGFCSRLSRSEIDSRVAAMTEAMTVDLLSSSSGSGRVKAIKMTLDLLVVGYKQKQ